MVVLWRGFHCDYQRGEDLESGTGGEVESRYKKMYEDDINPFTAFSKKVLFLLIYASMSTYCKRLVSDLLLLICRIMSQLQVFLCPSKCIILLIHSVLNLPY